MGPPGRPEGEGRSPTSLEPGASWTGLFFSLWIPVKASWKIASLGGLVQGAVGESSFRWSCGMGSSGRRRPACPRHTALWTVSTWVGPAASDVWLLAMWGDRAHKNWKVVTFD